MMNLADRVYVFCLEEDVGIMFYDQTPRGAVAELFGTLPEGVFLSSGEEVVKWDENVNGNKPDKVDKIMDCGSIIVKTRGEEYKATTFLVSKEIFVDIVKQIRGPHMVDYYKRLDMLRLFRNNDLNFNNPKKVKK